MSCHAIFLQFFFHVDLIVNFFRLNVEGADIVRCGYVFGL